MSYRPSGIWCDLCRKPILDDPWWHCEINGKANCHSCDKCKKFQEKKTKVVDDILKQETKGYLTNG